MINNLAKLLSSYKVEKPSRESIILVDGILVTSHNLIKMLVLSLAANKSLNLYPALLIGFEKNEQAETLFKTINARIINYTDYYKMIDKFKALCLVIFFSITGTPRKLLTYSIDGILIGDLVYDSIIRFEKRKLTINKITKMELKYLYSSLLIYFAEKRIANEYDIKILSLSHKYYHIYGILPRIILKQNKLFITTLFKFFKKITTMDELLNSDLRYSDVLDEKIKSIGVNQINDFINNRFNGEIVQHDVINAYHNKKNIESKEEFCRFLNLDIENPIATIVPHAFTDVPHCGSSMIYNDYYEWFVKTLEYIKEIKHITWLIKPHPSSAMYYEEGVVADLLQKNTNKNIVFVPNELSTKTIFKQSDAIVTIRGTAGLEAILFDCTSITCGSSVYNQDGDLSIWCKTEADYIFALTDIKKKLPLENKIKEKAMRCLYWWHFYFNPQSDLFGNEILPNSTADFVKDFNKIQYDKFADKLAGNELFDHPYVIKLIEFLKSEQPYLSGIEFNENTNKKNNP